MSVDMTSGSELDASNRRVLITGGCGFIGSHLAERLVADGASVTVYDSMRAGSVDNLSAVADRIRLVDGDVRDRAVIEAALEQCRPESVYHLAANASVPGSVEDPAYDYEANATGTFALLDTLRRLAMKPRVVLASSGAVYGQPDHFPITEGFPLRPISPYGYSKLCAEHIARMFLEVYGIPTVIARIFNAYGPRAPRYIVYDFLRKLERDPTRLEILGDGKQQRDFTYVTDTVDGLVLLAEKGVAGEAYNVSSGQNHSVTELAEMLVDALGLTGKVQYHCTGTSWSGDAQYWQVDVGKLRGLGFDGSTSLREGLGWTVRASRGRAAANG